MQNTRRPWSENDIAKLKGLAGKLPPRRLPPSWAELRELPWWRPRS
jgi:hypothetical protein